MQLEVGTRARAGLVIGEAAPQREADRQPLHVALHLAQRVNVCQELKDILNVKHKLSKKNFYIRFRQPRKIQLAMVAQCCNPSLGTLLFWQMEHRV